jgi:hypothetical protein
MFHADNSKEKVKLAVFFDSYGVHNLIPEKHNIKKTMYR